MLISVFSRGQGAGAGPVDYVIARKVRALDAEGKPIPGQFIERIPPPVIMAGDPELTRRLIDSSKNNWKYTSGVISFERNDGPTEAEQRAVMRDYENLAFAGLGQDEFNILWVRHEHCGNVELHFVIPRLHLGKQRHGRGVYLDRRCDERQAAQAACPTSRRCVAARRIALHRNRCRSGWR